MSYILDPVKRDEAERLRRRKKIGIALAVILVLFIAVVYFTPVVQTTARATGNGAFDKFNSKFEDLNASIKAKTGVTFFTAAKDLGDGIVEVTATDTWLKAPAKLRNKNLKTIFDLWDAADGTGLPIGVVVVDKAGKHRMRLMRR